MSTINTGYLTTSHTKIINFYRKNPHVNFELINCVLVDFLENLMIDSSEAKTKTIINENFADFLQTHNKLNVSMFGENKLCYILNKMYPSSCIENTNTSSSIILKRPNLSNIVFDNKQNIFNVSLNEVNNFITNCTNNNSSGIMISNTSGIATKNNFQIDIYDKNVLLYLHNTNYNEDIIYTAINILDYLTDKLSNIDPSIYTPLTDIQLLDINQEFQTFLNQKETIINYIRETNKKLVQQILDMELPSLNNFLTTTFVTTKTLDLKCSICNKFTGKNNKSLASHKKSCSKKD